VLEEVLAFAGREGYMVKGKMRSPVKGAKGNVEFLARLTFPAE
jgi:predicted rRNA methylase YqxC with S4 and FtsJ domains